MMSKDFLALLECFNLTQSVNRSIHCNGHTLDLLTASELFVSQLSPVDIDLSNHFAVFFNLDLLFSCVPTSCTVKSQKWKSIGLNLPLL